MADLTVEQRLTRLELISFPQGIVTSDDGSVSVEPAPAPIRVGEAQTFTVHGIPEGGRATIYSGMESIAMWEQDDPYKPEFRVRGVNGGLLSATAIITVQVFGPQMDAVGISFTVTIVPAGNLSASLTAVAS